MQRIIQFSYFLLFKNGINICNIFGYTCLKIQILSYSWLVGAFKQCSIIEHMFQYIVYI